MKFTKLTIAVHRKINMYQHISFTIQKLKLKKEFQIIIKFGHYIIQLLKNLIPAYKLQIFFDLHESLLKEFIANDKLYSYL